MGKQDLTKIEMDDRPEPKTPPKPAPKPRPDPRDANIFTADKGIQPPSPDEGPTKGKKKGGCVKMAKGGSASARADGIAQRGKTRGSIC